MIGSVRVLDTARELLRSKESPGGVCGYPCEDRRGVSRATLMRCSKAAPVQNVSVSDLP